MEDIDIKSLLDKITIENVNRQIADGWQSAFFIAEYIVGLDVWKSLSRDDQRMLAHHVNKVMENKIMTAE